MEGQLLPAGSSGGEDAALLRRPLLDGRDQLHLLSDAHSEARHRLGGASPVVVSLHAEGAASHHPRSQAARRRRSGARVLRGGRRARAAAGARCCFSSRRTSRRTSPPSTSFSASCRRGSAARSSSGTSRGWTKRSTRGSATATSRLCIADSEKRSTPVMTTADYAYLRLRDEGYTEDHITRVGRHGSRSERALQGRVRVLQARRRRERRDVRQDAAREARADARR